MDRWTLGRVACGLATSARAGAATVIVVLPAFWSMLQFGAWWSPPLDAVVFAVMLAVSLPRALTRTNWTQVPLAVALFLMAGAGAVGCSLLLGAGAGFRALGAVLFSVGVAVPVWLRRLGPTWQAAGALAALPFLAVLIQPAPAQPTWGFLGWMSLGAGIALTWALLVRSLTTADSAPAESPPPRRATGLSASTRMALQLAVATGAAFVVAQVLDPDHLVWPVLTVLIVHSGNRGRGDVLAKGAQRIVGALAGTGIAALVGGLFGAGDRAALVMLFATLAVAAAARPHGYVYWAAGITASLVLLYAYFGQSGIELLGHRLLGVIAGGVLAIAAAWFLLPVRTLDVARLRLTQVLAAAAEATGLAARAEPTTRAARRLRAADQQLATLDPTARAARCLGLGATRGLSALLADAHELAGTVLTAIHEPIERAGLGQLAQEIANTARRAADKRHPLATASRSAGNTVLTDVLNHARNVNGSR